MSGCILGLLYPTKIHKWLDFYSLITILKCGLFDIYIIYIIYIHQVWEIKYILDTEIWQKPPNRDNESKLINQESEIKISTNCFPCFCFQLNYSYKEQFIGVIINLKLDLVQSSPPVQTRLKRTEPKYISINKT